MKWCLKKKVAPLLNWGRNEWDHITSGKVSSPFILVPLRENDFHQDGLPVCPDASQRAAVDDAAGRADQRHDRDVCPGGQFGFEDFYDGGDVEAA